MKGAEVGGTPRLGALPYGDRMVLVRRMNFGMLDVAEEVEPTDNDRGGRLQMGSLVSRSTERDHWSCHGMEAVAVGWCGARHLFGACRSRVLHMVFRDSSMAAWHMTNLTRCLMVAVSLDMRRAKRSCELDLQEAQSGRGGRSDHDLFALNTGYHSRKQVMLDCGKTRVVPLGSDRMASDRRNLSKWIVDDSGMTASDWRRHFVVAHDVMYQCLEAAAFTLVGLSVMRQAIFT